MSKSFTVSGPKTSNLLLPTSAWANAFQPLALPEANPETRPPSPFQPSLDLQSHPQTVSAAPFQSLGSQAQPREINLRRRNAQHGPLHVFIEDGVSVPLSNVDAIKRQSSTMAFGSIDDFRAPISSSPSSSAAAPASPGVPQRPYKIDIAKLFQKPSESLSSSDWQSPPNVIPISPPSESSSLPSETLSSPIPQRSEESEVYSDWSTFQPSQSGNISSPIPQLSEESEVYSDWNTFQSSQSRNLDISPHPDQANFRDIQSESPTLQICAIFATIFADKERYRALLSVQGPTAQRVVDLIHMLLDSPGLKLGRSLKNNFLVALLRLTAKSGLHPKYVTLRGVHFSQSPLTSGHFGEIWKGQLQGQDICLKVVKVYQMSDINRLLKAFSKEAILWCHISHPCLLPFYGIYHLDDAHGRICLASPWMENGNVSEYLRSNPQASRLSLVSDIARGIEYLHDNNIVHGDLKGANILVNGSHRACLGDFGLSTILDSDAEILKWTSVQSTTRQSGTVRWQAPELVDPDYEDAPASKESDIYAFACVCYEVFTGWLPFHEVTRDATVTLKVIRGERPSRPAEEDMSNYTFGINNSMWDMMQSCWKGNPAERIDMKEVLRLIDLETYFDDGKFGDWGNLSSSKFRNAIHGPAKKFSWGDLQDIKSWLLNVESDSN